ncbi:hypothetical protein D9611_009038 [Ephemerocybe angulata]|uniref:Uncharacterized protein n=1 Tax=Ephemerocybe angulata TaxID=980116 RepID=A0A8H5FJS7_9AGAR|nr:hypothetical protein D9611_009038 [Tulosesus angulatus]
MKFALATATALTSFAATAYAATETTLSYRFTLSALFANNTAAPLVEGYQATPREISQKPLSTAATWPNAGAYGAGLIDGQLLATNPAVGGPDSDFYYNGTFGWSADSTIAPASRFVFQRQANGVTWDPSHYNLNVFSAVDGKIAVNGDLTKWSLCPGQGGDPGQAEIFYNVEEAGLNPPVNNIQDCVKVQLVVNPL